MATETESIVTFTAGEAITAAYLRVKASGRTVRLADASDYGIGCIQKACSSGDKVAIRLDAAGTSKMVASAAITAGAKVYAAASGKIAATGTLIVGTALDAASGNNSVIEVLPHRGLNQSSSSSSSSSSSGS